MKEEDSRYKNAGKGDFKNRAKLPIETPDSLEILERNNQLSVTKAWKTPSGYFLLVFSLIWIGFASTFITSALSSFDGMWFIAIPFLTVPVFFVFIGFGMLYLALQFIYNTSTVSIRDEQVFIETKPFARKAKKSLYKHEIKQIFTKESSLNQGSGSGSHSLFYIDQHGKSKPLIAGLSFMPVAFPFFREDEAKYFERKIEDFLNIEDVDIKTYETNQSQLKGAVYNEHGEEIGYREEQEELLDTMPIPNSMEVEESNHEVLIFRAWRSPIAIFILIFGLIWSSIIAPMAYGVLANIGQMGAMGILVVLFLVPFVGVGLGMIYTAFATWFNTTTVHLDRDYLRVSHHPLPWKGAIRIPTKEILNIDVRQETRRGKNGNYTVTILSVTQKGKYKPITINYGNLNPVDEECLFIEYKLKKFLNKNSY